MNTMNTVTIGEGWDRFRRQVIPATLSDGQVSDMRACFYAGALVVLETVNTLADIDSDVVSILVLEILQREKRAYLGEAYRWARQEPPSD